MSTSSWGYDHAEGWTEGMDLTGFRVEAEDGHIGKIDKHSYEVDQGQIVVDTGPWIFGREVLLPAGVVQRVEEESRTVWVNRTREQIKEAPTFHHVSHLADSDYRRDAGGQYGRI
ncbi:PRC-barrel domain containing protein [Kitasatospora sp. NPDC088391]|uniref:PRC-barrel domain containing protein n=1 Tax=Kitasatospora sp. NPDC088391 TaxID=3364074 RepID=UPI0037F90EFA